MELTHDNCLYVIEYEFEGQTIRHTFQNRCVYLDVEGLHFDYGLDALKRFLLPHTKGELGYVDIDEDIDEDEEEYEERETWSMKTDDLGDPSNLDNPDFIEQLEREGKLNREKQLFRKGGFRFSHNRFNVSVREYDKETKEEHCYTIGYLPASATPMLRLWIDEETWAWVEDYSLNPESPYLKVSVTAFLYFLNDENAKNFHFYRIRPEHAIMGGDLMNHAESVDWKSFCKGVMDQQMELGSEYKLMDDWFCCMNRWTCPHDVHFDKIFKSEKDNSALSIDDYMLHVPLERISEQILPDDVYDAMAGCVIGFMTNIPYYKSGRHWALVPPYDRHHPMSLSHKQETDNGYFHIADVPSEYNDKIKNFIEGEHTPAFIHLTTEFVDDQPKVTGDMFLLKCYEGHEEEIQSFAKWLFGEMNHKNDFPEKLYYSWKKQQEGQVV